jgi:hypothetical protein
LLKIIFETIYILSLNKLYFLKLLLCITFSILKYWFWANQYFQDSFWLSTITKNCIVVAHADGSLLLFRYHLVYYRWRIIFDFIENDIINLFFGFDFIEAEKWVCLCESVDYLVNFFSRFFLRHNYHVSTFFKSDNHSTE